MGRNTLMGIGFILIVHICGAALLAAIRVMSEMGFHSFQLVFFYFAGPLVALIPWALVRKWDLKTTRWRLYSLRAAFEFGGFGLSFIGLSMMTMPMHTALTFTVPLFGIILAVLILREKATYHAALSLVLGAAGVIFITDPWGGDVNIGVLLVLVASCMFAICGVCIKLMTTTESPNKIMFFTYICTSLVTLPFAVSEWSYVGLIQVPLVVAISALSMGQQFFVAKAYQYAPMSVIVPMQFSLLVFVSILGYFLFEEVVTRDTLIGSVCILAGTIYHIYHASRHNHVEPVKAS